MQGAGPWAGRCCIPSFLGTALSPPDVAAGNLISPFWLSEAQQNTCLDALGIHVPGGTPGEEGLLYSLGQAWGPLAARVPCLAGTCTYWYYY